LVLTGKLDNVGNPIRQNSGNSFRAGIELDASFKVLEKLIIRPNFTISANKNVDFIISENGILKNIGNTPIAFSPDLIAGNILSFLPAANFKLDLLSKYVSQQYMSNLNDKNSSLKDYFINDFNASYQISGTKIFKTATINLLINNLLDVMYVSNGVDYGGGNIYYYPQAGTHFLLGLNLKF
jgi:iron complex outermembrane receptor protein